MVAGVALIAGAGQADAAVASSISVKGNERIEAETIRTYITIKAHKSYGASDIDASVKALYDTGLFADVSIVPRGSVLVVTVVENPVINSVTFEGTKKVKANVLTQVVDSRARDVLTDAKLQSDIQRVKDYYARSGRSDAYVTANVTKLSNNRVDVVFIVQEGKRTGVSTIQFVGNHAFSARRLAGIIQTRKTNFLSWLNKRDVYTEDKLQADQEALRAFYLSHGYADFQVLDANATLGPNGKYTVTFTIDEGPKYRFGDVTVNSSITGVNVAALERVVSAKKGHTFNANDVQKSLEALSIELARQGFVFSQVRPRGDRDYVGNLVNLTFVVDEGPRAYVERIEIRGNSKTRDYVIRREMDVAEGDPYNRVLLDRAERRLRNLGYFKTVSINSVPGSAPDEVVVVVNVEDQSTGNVSIAAGYSTSDGIIGELALEETNFLGRGQKLRASVGGGFNSQTYNLSFTDPYFLGTHIAAGFDIYRNVDNASSVRPYDATTTGGNVRIGLPITDDLNVELNYKLSSVNTTNAAACAPAGSPATVSACYFPNGTRVTSSAGYAVVYSTLDSKFDPKEGLYLKVSQDFAGIGGDASFMRSQGDARYFHPVIPGSDVIGMLKVTGGNITGLGSKVAIADNFVRGGETVRGFAPLGFGPRDTTPGATTGGGLSVGGKNFVAGTAEVTFPLPFMPPDFGLRGAVFGDAGVLFGVDNPGNGVSYVSDTSVRTSLGASLIWASPFGQIRADFAKAMTYKSYDNLQVFRLGAGTQF